MSMTSNGGTTPPPAAPAGDQPSLGVVAQYVKDFSFENPNAPRSLPMQVQPRSAFRSTSTSIGAATPARTTDFEVELKLEGKAEANNSVLFGFELVFAGVFRITNVPRIRAVRW